MVKLVLMYLCLSSTLKSEMSIWILKEMTKSLKYKINGKYSQFLEGGLKITDVKIVPENFPTASYGVIRLIMG